MRKAKLPKIKGLKLLTNLNGHSVSPGLYKAQLIVDKDTSIIDINIIAHPGIDASQQDYDEQYEFLNDVERTFIDVHLSVNRMYEVRNQLKSQKPFLEKVDNTKDLIALNDSIVKKIDKWVENLIQPKQKTFQDIINFPNQLNAELGDLIGRTDGMFPQVTEGSKKRFNDLRVEWENLFVEMNGIIDNEVSDYQKMYVDKKIPIVIVPSKA